MSEVIKTGGMGKNPAIEKMNQLQAVKNTLQGAALLEERAFLKHSGKGLEEIQKRKQIIEDFQISFKPKAGI